VNEAEPYADFLSHAAELREQILLRRHQFYICWLLLLPVGVIYFYAGFAVLAVGAIVFVRYSLCLHQMVGLECPRCGHQFIGLLVGRIHTPRIRANVLRDECYYCGLK